ncbi:MAG: hypothetical protein KGI83_03815 [Verrucomicrobiota bacterium]|nr:hypothetical protein [Verrucomicrobiota bacterium]
MMAPAIRVLGALTQLAKKGSTDDIFKFALNFITEFGDRVIVQVGDRKDEKWAEKRTPVWLTSNIVGKIFKLSFGNCEHGHINTACIAMGAPPYYGRFDNVRMISRKSEDDLPYFYYLLRGRPLPRKVLFDNGVMWPACHCIQQSLVNGRSIKFLAPVLENLLRSREQEIAKYKKEREAGGPVDPRLTDQIERDFRNIWAPALLGALNGANPECASLVAYCTDRMARP